MRNSMSALEVMETMNTSYNAMIDEFKEVQNIKEPLLQGLDKLEKWDAIFNDSTNNIEEKYTERLNDIKSSLDNNMSKLNASVLYLNTKNILPNTGVDITNELQMILNSVEENATLIFEKGEYILENEPTITKPINILGNGVVLKNNTTKATLKIKDTNNVTISGITFDGLWDGNASILPRWNNDGLYITSSTNIHIDNCIFKNYTDSGLRVSNSENENETNRITKNITVTNCYFDNIVQISTTFGGVENYIFNGNILCNIKSQLKFASNINPCKNVIITNNIFSNFNNLVQSGGAVIKLENVVNVNISNNVFENMFSTIDSNVMGAIRCSNTFNNVAIKNNQFLDISDVAILLDSGKSNLIEINDNTFKNCKRFIESKSNIIELIDVSNNTFDTSSTSAFYLRNVDSVDKLVFKGNKCFNLSSTENNFYINSTNTFIFKNNSLINSGKGIMLYGVKQSQIINNDLLNTHLLLYSSATSNSQIKDDYKNRTVYMINNNINYDSPTTSTGFMDINQVNLYAYNNSIVNVNNCFKVTNNEGFKIDGNNNYQVGASYNTTFPVNQ